jgi:NADH:ubiquinone oxidoreductase subunit H
VRRLHVLPFDLPEAEGELVARVYWLNYAAVSSAYFFIAEYMSLFCNITLRCLSFFLEVYFAPEFFRRYTPILELLGYLLKLLLYFILC